MSSLLNPDLVSPAVDTGDSADPGTFPVSLTLCGLVAMAALYLLPAPFGGFNGLWLLGALLVLPHFTRRRLPDVFMARWTARLAAYGAILFVLGWPSDPIGQWYVKPEFMSRIGPMMAAEFVLRACLPVVPGRRAYAWGEALLVAVLTMIPATTTYMPGAVFYLAPAQVLLSLLVIRRIGDLATPRQVVAVRAAMRGQKASKPRGQRKLLATFRLVFAVAALAMGLVVTLSMRTLDQQVTQWAMRLLNFDRSQKGEIGLGKDPELGPIFNPKPSMDRALLLREVRGERHVRVFAYTTLSNNRWLPTQEDRDFSAVDKAALAATRPAQRSYTIEAMSTGAQGYFAVPAGTVGLTTTLPVERDAQGVLRPAAENNLTSWIVAEDAPDGVTGDILLPAPSRTMPGGTPAMSSDLLDLTGVNPGIVTLAREKAGQGRDSDRLGRLQLFLRSNYNYSLRYDPPKNGLDPLADFVLNRRAAHCQYFASAMVMMARAAGLPARMVTGFYAYEVDGDDTLVRERDAHAWAEVYIAGTGWVVADATPSAGRPDEIYPEPSYLRKLWERLTDLPGNLRRWIASGALFRLLIPIFIVAAIISLVRSLWRRWHTARPTEADVTFVVDPRVVEAGVRFAAVLEREGLAAGPAQTWESLLWEGRPGNDLAPPDAATAGELNAFVARYNKLRFGTGPAGADDTNVSDLLQRLAQLESRPRRTSRVEA